MHSVYVAGAGPGTAQKYTFKDLGKVPLRHCEGNVKVTFTRPFLTHSRRDLLNLQNCEYLQLGTS